MSGTLASLVVRVGADIKGFVGDMNRATTLSQRRTKQITQSFKRMGIGATAAMGVAINEAVKFEKAMAEVSTLLDDTSGIDNLTDAVRDLSREYGSAPVDTAKALYQIISAGASDAASQMELLHASNKLAIGGVTDVKTAADGLTTVLNAYGMEAGEASHVSDLLFVGMKQGKTTIEELSSSIGQVATIAAQTGVGLDELIAATATLTKSGIATSEAMSGIRGVLSAVMKQGSQSVKMADELGISFNVAAIESKGFAGWLAEVQEKTGGSSEKLAKLFGRVEGLTAVMSLGANEGKEYNSVLEEAANAAGATDEAFAKMSETVGFQLGQLKATSQVLMEEIGSRMLPTVNLLAQGLLNLLGPSKDVETALENVKKSSEGLASVTEGTAQLAAASSHLETTTVALIATEQKLNEIAEQKERWYNKTTLASKVLTAEEEHYRKKQEELWQEIKRLRKEIEEKTKATKKAASSSKIFAGVNKQLGEALRIVEQRTKDLKKAEEELNQSYRTIIDTYLPLKSAQLEHQENLAEIERLHASGKLVGEEYSRVIAAEADRHMMAKKAAIDHELGIEEVIVTAKKFSGKYPKYMKKVEESTTGVVAVIENSFKRLDNTFQTFWTDLVRNGKISLRGIKDLFLDTIAQMLHAALTQPIVLRIGATMTGGLASGAASASGGSIFGGAGGFAGMVDGFGSLWGGQGGWMGVGENAAGLGGGYLGYRLGGNTNGAAQIGSLAGGLALGYAGGIVGGILGGPVGAIVGKALGSFIGSLVGNLIGGLFGSKPRIKAGAAGYFTGGGGLNDTRFFDSAFGGVYVGKTKGGLDEHVQDFGDALKQMDDALAGFMNNNQIEKVTQALANWGMTLKGDAISIEDMLNSRFSVILSTFGQNVQDYVNQFQGLEAQTEALGRFVTALNTVGATIANFVASDPATALADQLEDASKTSTMRLQDISDTLVDLFAGFDGTPEMLDQISQAIDARYRGEMEYLQAVDQLVKGIAASIEQQQQSIRETIEGPRSFSELMGEATLLLQDISSAGSPEELAQIVSQIQSLVGKAFGGLDQAAQAAQAETLISFLDTVQRSAEEQAAALAQMVVDEGVVLREQAQMFAESIGAPLDMNVQATDAVNDSVNRQTDIIIRGNESRDELLEELLREIRLGNSLADLRG